MATDEDQGGKTQAKEDGGTGFGDGGECNPAHTEFITTTTASNIIT